MDKNKRKALTLRLPKDLWVFISKKSIDREMSINDVVIDRLKKYKEKCENKLTRHDGMVS